MPDSTKYECEICDYWEAIHGLKDYHDDKFKKCQNCTKRVEHYRTFVEKQGE